MTDKEPTDAQKKAGNYPKEHVFKHGMRFSIENKAGSVRKGTGKDGTPWEFKMAHDYGYVRGSKGKDKDHVDVFFGPDADNKEGEVYVIDQDDDEGNFDEHKAMFGFPDANAAYAAYHENYPEGHAGFRAITPMPIGEFRKWAYVGADGGKRKRVSELVKYARGGSVDDAGAGEDAADAADGLGAAEQPARETFPDGASVDPAKLQAHFSAGGADTSCECGNETVMMAEGGSVEERPYVGYRGRRKERNNDREGAKDFPLQLARGAVTGTLGFGGDIEGLLRKGYNLPSANPVQALLRAVTGKVDETPALPTSEFYSDVLPLKPTSAAGRAGEGIGQAAGMPASAVALGGVRAAKAAAPAVRGALTQLAENAAAPRRLSSQAGAVKLPGGNWYDPRVESASRSMRGWEPDEPRRLPNIPADAAADIEKVLAKQPMSVADWMEKRIGKYIRNEMGTPNDPLVSLEAQGISHFTPEGLQQQAREAGLWIDENLPAGQFRGDPLHKELTGRDTRSPWEALSDAPIIKERAEDMRELRDAPAYLKKVPGDSTIHDIDFSAMDGLGFDHVRDYLDAATQAGRLKQLGLQEGLRADEALIARGLDIDQDKLGMMSLPDVVRKTHEWNKLLAETKKIKDRNKGIKTVLKQYEQGHPNEGFQWAELGPEGLADEGNAMGHCVGGYCDSVESGRKRIVSLRDRDGQPHVTVELAPGQAEGSFDWFRKNPELEKKYPNPGNDDYAVRREWWKTLDESPEYKAYKESVPWEIRQIKGKQNVAPVKDYLPAVQDFVKNMGPWGDVRDLQNTGLISKRDLLRSMAPNLGKYRMSSSADSFMRDADDLPDFLQQDEVVKHLLGKGWTELKGNRLISPEDAAHPDYQDAVREFRVEPPRYAKGGTVMGEETVGQAQFNPRGGGAATGTSNPSSPTLGGPIGPSINNGGLNLPMPLTMGGDGYTPNRNNAPIFSASGLSHNMSRPYMSTSGVVLRDPNQDATPANAGSIDPALRMTLSAGGAGWADRGANAFLGGGFNPWGRETGPSEGESVAPQNQGAQIDQLFELAGNLGIDTSRYSRTPGAMDIRGGRSGSNDAMALYDAVNDATKDFVSVGGLSNGWSGGPGNTASRTIYREVDGRLLPVTRPQFRGNNQDNGFFSQEFKDAVMTTILPAFGGWAGLAGQAGATAGLSGAQLTAANAAINAAGGYLTGGPQGALSSIGGSLGGWGGETLGNAAGGYGAVGRTLGTQVGRRLASG